MKKFLFASFALLALIPTAASAQSVVKRNSVTQGEAGVVQVPTTDSSVAKIQAVTIVTTAGAAVAGATSDATAVNQTTQIVAAQLTNTTLGTVADSPTTNTIGDRLKTINTTLGTPFQAGGSIQPYALAGSRWQYAAASGGISNTTTAVTVAAAAGGTLRNYVTGVQCSGSTLGAATELAIRDGVGGAALWRGYLATTAMSPNSVSFAVPLRGTANTLVEIVTLTASITGAVYCNMQGYTAN